MIAEMPIFCRSYLFTVDNWSSIIEYFDDFTVNEVIVKLSSYTYQLIASEDYKNIAEDLFSKIAKVSNIIFVYESLWSGVVDIDEDQYQDEALSFYNYRPDPPDEMLDQSHCHPERREGAAPETALRPLGYPRGDTSH